MKGYAELVRHLMNGAKIPNWVGLIAWIVSMVWMAATTFFGSRATTTAINGRVDSLAVSVATRFEVAQGRAERRNKETNEELKRIGAKVNYIARGIE